MFKLIIIAVLCFIFPIIPFLVSKVHLITFYAFKDLYGYFKYQKWNEFKGYGKILTFNGLFGTGKTLSCTHYILGIYNKYNGKMIWDSDNKEWVEQRIHIVSNYHLENIPYEPLVSERQLIEFGGGYGDVYIFVLDEISAIFNNRDYKNFTPDLLTSMLQCRKRKALFLGTAQRFSMQDKNFRITMETANQCKKTWRIVKIATFDAYQLENCTNAEMLKPLRVKYWFVRDVDYNSYDTSEMVAKLSKDSLEGRMLTSEEISAKQGDINTDTSFATSRKRRFRKRTS